MKEISVPNTRSPSQVIEIKYQLFGNRCVFTATSSAAEQGSSINFAEEIIEAIARTEGREVLTVRFFDLQTRLSYEAGFTRPHPGDFEFDEVIIELRPGPERICAVHWAVTRCSEEVVNAFREFIDGNPHQVLPRDPDVVF